MTTFKIENLEITRLEPRKGQVFVFRLPGSFASQGQVAAFRRALKEQTAAMPGLFLVVCGDGIQLDALEGLEAERAVELERKQSEVGISLTGMNLRLGGAKVGQSVYFEETKIGQVSSVAGEEVDVWFEIRSPTQRGALSRIRRAMERDALSWRLRGNLIQLEEVK